MDVPGFAFRGPGLDRAELLRENPDELRRRWPTAAVMVVDADGNARFPEPAPTPPIAAADVDGPSGTALTAAAVAAELPAMPAGADLAADLPAAASLLGLAGDTTWFALPHEAQPAPLPVRIDLRSAAAQWPALEAGVLAQARALLHWHQRNRFCGACGHALAPDRAGWRARCDGCGLEHYPRTDPAIIVAVSDGERLLLGRQASWPARRWSVLAGFVEPGESLEQAIAREVMEEAGVPVLASRYEASQPWPFPAALMVGFHAIGEPVEPVVSDELEQVRWFSRDDLDAAVASGELLLSPRISIARQLIEQWRARIAACPSP